MALRANYSGLVIAGTGFFLTRFTVSLALYEDPFHFYLGGIVPLVLGLGLAAFGVALVVADIDAALVRTTAGWCVVGAGTMSVLVVLTLAATNPNGMLDIGTVRSQTYLSNFLIGGSVGGTFTGLYAATSQNQRVELRRQANRLEVLNRLLRHEVLNAVTVIKGHASLAVSGTPETWDVIEERSNVIEQTIDEVKYLARDANASGNVTQVENLGGKLEASIESVRQMYPDVRISLDAPPDVGPVRATDRLDRVFVYLLEEVVDLSTGDEPEITVSVVTTPGDVRIGFRYDGRALSAKQRLLLEHGEIGRFDDPTMGFSLHVVRLLVENSGGAIETGSESGRGTISVVLNRSDSGVTRYPPNELALAGVISAIPQLVVGLVASLIAGVVYGIASEMLGGSIAGIGVFYGTASPVVGWITHEFHSVVFGFVFLGLVSRAPNRFRHGIGGYVIIGALWAVVLWIVAAGVIAPIWLRLLGIPASIPSFSSVLLVSHLGWGISLGILTKWGQQHVMPRLT